MKHKTLEALGLDIALAYHDAKEEHFRGVWNDAVFFSYQALKEESFDLYAELVADGYTFEPWNYSGQPYESHAEMQNSIKYNKHLFYFRTASAESTPINPLMDIKANDVFRCVHDILGHFEGDADFTFAGEMKAFQSQSDYYSGNALIALATETIGQNAWLNFHPSNPERNFAPQKAIALPEALIVEALGWRFEEEPQERVSLFSRLDVAFFVWRSFRRHFRLRGEGSLLASWLAVRMTVNAYTKERA